MTVQLIEVDPAELYLPGSRLSGADPAKLQRQLSLHGLSTDGMPNLWVVIDPDGRIMLNDGVTRATRVAKFLPGVKLKAEVVGRRQRSCASHPQIKDRLP